MQGCSPTHAMFANRRCCVFAIFRQKRQCPKITVIEQNDQFSDSAYHRRSEAEPDIESGLQDCLLILFCSSNMPLNLDSNRDCQQQFAEVVPVTCTIPVHQKAKAMSLMCFWLSSNLTQHGASLQGLGRMFHPHPHGAIP